MSNLIPGEGSRDSGVASVRHPQNNIRGFWQFKSNGSSNCSIGKLTQLLQMAQLT